MSVLYKLRTKCALCQAPGEVLQTVLELAPTPLANEFVSESDLGIIQEFIPLTLRLCADCGHVQLAEVVDPKRLFQNYVYVSGTSSVFVDHFASLAKTAVETFALGPKSLVVDIGSNDGTLLKQFQKLGIKNVLGVDPATEIVKEAVAAGVPTQEGFFTPELASEIREWHGPANMICANNVFAHSGDLRSFALGVGMLLGDDGVFVFEVSYLVDVIQKLLFDTIYHEHVSYHSLGPLVSFFNGLGLRLFDAERVGSHGGSVRCYVSHRLSLHKNTERLNDLLRVENDLALFDAKVYGELKLRIYDRAIRTRNSLQRIRAGGGSIAGFGAPAKLTTLMYQFGLDERFIDFIVDDSPWKQGKYAPGTHIPVLPTSELYAHQPAACVIFAWNFADSIMEKHRDYQKNGGRFIVPLPELREI